MRNSGSMLVLAVLLAGCGLRASVGPFSASGAVLDLTQKSTGAKLVTVDVSSQGVLAWASEQLSGTGLGKLLFGAPAAP